MRTFAISALHEPPFPACRHEATDRVAEETLAWARHFGLITSGHRLRRADPAGLAGRACPDGPVEHLRLLADLICWLFVMDDACDEDGLGDAPTRLAPTVAVLLDVLDRHGDPAAQLPTGGGALGDALDDLCRRVRSAGHAGMLLRFASQTRQYLMALLWEAANREHSRVPRVREYVQMRRHTGGVPLTLTLTDLAIGAAAGPAPRADPALAALDLLAADLICWCNDVFSYGKENRAGPDVHNLVSAIAGETGGDEEAALRAAADQFNLALAAYVEGEAALLATGEAAVRPVLRGRRHWIRATYDWSRIAARYA
ncbi:terpene synthase family protein [Micromonospora sp. BQ11]|uniref:terpene synthase family protein n=1 Tax=Micromonospora sp. BQ11 TaxID=3452212 RepID=UPI003F8CAA63